MTASKTNLGKVLFWDEQLSSTRTVSCGSCHAPATGGSDPRSSATTIHPGPDGIAGNADDIVGSPGVPLNNANGTYELEDFFGMAAQITGRYAPSSINAGYANNLFWDGRAGNTFRDPVTNQVVLPTNAALESQAAGPPLSGGEMAHQGRDWNQVADRVEKTKPLTLAPSLPADLETWINDRNYPALFTEAYGNAEVTPAKIIMAIATYERTLVSNQAPFDALIGGNQNALTALENQGRQIFGGRGRCVTCHGGNRLTDDNFHYIGVRPQADDPGRFAVTGNNQDQGRIKTPSLRNVELRGEYMHNGRFSTLAEVVDFYDRGGDFDAPNKDNNIRPLNLTQGEKGALIAFLSRPLTDPRVSNETGVFSIPDLYAGSAQQPEIGNDSVLDDDNNTPLAVAIEPALAGNSSFTLGLHGVDSGRSVFLAIDDSPIASGSGIPTASSVKMLFDVTTDSDGSISQAVAIPGGAAFSGKSLFAKWFVTGDGTTGESATISAPVFSESAGNILPPSDIAASNDQSDQIDLSWTAVPDAVSYEVYRSETSDFDDAVRLSSVGTPSFSDTGIPPESVLHYWVVSVSDHEASSLSTAATGYTYDLSGFTLNTTDGTSSTATDLSWTSQNLAASYVLYVGTSASPAEMIEIGNLGDVSNYSDVTGTAGRTYYYRLLALDAGGEQIANSEVSDGSRALAAPEGLTASVATHQDKIALSWNTNPEATGYNLYVLGNTGYELLATTTGTSYDQSDASAGIDYSYKASAYNQYGEGMESSTVTGYRAVSAPGGVSASIVQGSNEIQISWTNAEGVLEYAIFRSLTDDFADAVELGVSSGSSYSDSTTDPGQTYYYWVASIDESNDRIVEAADSTVGTAGDVTPDLKIGRTFSSQKGNDIYNNTGAGQICTIKTRRFRTITSRVTIENDGNIDDLIRLAGAPGNSKFKITYFRIAPIPTNMTSAIIAGTGLTDTVSSGDSESIQVTIKPVRSRLKNRKRTYSYTASLRATSTIDTTQTDCVKTKAKTNY